MVVLSRATSRLPHGLCLLACLALLLLRTGPGHAAGWACSLAGVADDRARALAIDTAGNAYVVGEYRGQPAFYPGAVPLAPTASAYQAGLVAKITPAGALAWARPFTSGGDLRVTGVAAAGGRVYVAGDFQKPLTLAGTTLTSRGGKDLFLATLDAANGAVLAACSLGGTGTETDALLAVDGPDTLYLACSSASTAVALTPDALAGAGPAGPGVQLWQYALPGGLPTPVWGCRVEENATSRPQGVAGAGGGAVLAGVARCPGVSDDIFVARVNAAGALHWRHLLGGAGADGATGVAVARDGALYVAGAFQGTVDFDPTAAVCALTSQGDGDGFVMQLAPDGAVRWARAVGSTGDDTLTAAAATPDGGVLVTGRWVSPTATAGDVVVARFAADGLAAWQRTAGSSATDLGTALATDAVGNPLVAGVVGGTCALDPAQPATALTAVKAADAFLWYLEVVPPAPVVQAVAVDESTVALTWASVPLATGYELQWSPDGTAWLPEGTPCLLGADTSSWQDTTVPPSTTRHYRLRALASGEASAWSLPVAATTPEPALVAQAGALTTAEDVPVEGRLLATGPASDHCVYALVTDGMRGTVTLLDPATGAYRYTPPRHAHGSDRFAFRATTPEGAAASATISVTVSPCAVIVDNADGPGRVAVTGAWGLSGLAPGCYGQNYLQDNNNRKGTKSVRFTPELPVGADYAVSLRWRQPAATLATNVPVEIISAAGKQTLTVNQRAQGGTWVSLGVFPFPRGTAGSVTVRTTGTDGYVVADAVRFVKVTEANHAPALTGGELVTGEDVPLTGRLPLVDPDGDPLTITVTGGEALGTFAISEDGAYTFTPARHVNGAATLTVTADDGDLACTGSLAVRVEPRAITLDNADPIGVMVTGSWGLSAVTPGGYGPNYLQDKNAGKGAKSVRYTPTLPCAATYQVQQRWRRPAGTLAASVPVDIAAADGLHTVVINQRETGGDWVSLGDYPFAAGTAGSVTIRTTGTVGYVVADAVRFVRTDSGNRPPEARDAAVTATADAPCTLALPASDPDGDDLTAEWVTPPAHGDVRQTAAGLTYTPAAGYTGPDSFTYRVSDGDRVSAPATVTITVLPAAILLDNTAPEVTLVGDWRLSALAPGSYGPNYLHDNNQRKGTKTVRFTPALPAAGRYQLWMRWRDSAATLASNVPVDIQATDGLHTVVLNQRTTGGVWTLLGTYGLAADGTAQVTVRTDGTDGYVVVDAVKLLPEA